MQMIFCYVQFTQGTAVAHDISRLFASFSFRNDIAAREKGEREKEKEEKKQSYCDTFYAMNPFLPSSLFLFRTRELERKGGGDKT